MFTSNAIDLERFGRVDIPASLGVAENGAVWLPENTMINRLIPFICQHLVIVLNIDKNRSEHA